MLVSTTAGSDERAGEQDDPVRELAAQLAALRLGASAEHPVRLGLDALSDVSVATDVTPQERARLRAALIELRAYAGAAPSHAGTPARRE